MVYQRQFLPARNTRVVQQRVKYYDPNYKLKKMRSIPDEDFLNLLGFRMLGQRYLSVHPPLEETGEPEDPMRELVEPTAGAKAGDRVVTVVFTDSIYGSMIAPYMRMWMYHTRYRGVDGASYSSRCTLELRERELEAAARELFETEVLDPARDCFRQYACTGHSIRLDENGMMFDALSRVVYDKEKGEVVQVKDGFGIILDKPVSLGKPAPEEELRQRRPYFREDHASGFEPMYGAEEVFDDTPEDIAKRGDITRHANEFLLVQRRISDLRWAAGINPQLLNNV